MPEPILKLVHDFNDRLPNGNYSVWLRPGTRVVMFDGDTVVQGAIEIGGFIQVKPSYKAKPSDD